MENTATTTTTENPWAELIGAHIAIVTKMARRLMAEGATEADAIHAAHKAVCEEVASWA